mgnify:FL=1
MSSSESVSSVRGPYKSSIPGRVRIENHDFGREGTEYQEIDSKDRGGEYRPSKCANIGTTHDLGGGYNVGWVAAGEWAEYTVGVKKGTYDVEFRLSSPYESRQLSLSLDGNTLGAVTDPDTGGWQDWATVTLSGVLISGGSSQILRIDADDGNYNINWVQFKDHVDQTSIPIPEDDYGDQEYIEFTNGG